MPELVAVSEEFAGVHISLTGEQFTVGREEGNSIVIPHPSLSSEHAVLTPEGGDYRLTDLGSTNGTYVNDEQVSEVLLHNGDHVGFGQVVFAYQSAAVSAAPPLPQGEVQVALTSTGAGRPAHFRNFSQIKKGAKKAAAMPVPVVLGLLLALGGLGYLGFVVFTG
jgi:hypothetical protein